MEWMYKYRKVWRIAILVLLLLAIMAPWAFDRVNVPAQYPCDPYVRLEGDFCGIPIRGITVLYILASGFISIFVESLKHQAILINRAGVLLVSILLSLLVLPFVSTLLLILRGDSQSRQVFSIVAWSLAAGVCMIEVVLMSLSDSLGYSYYLWGIWLYMALALIALALEVSTLVAERSLGREDD